MELFLDKVRIVFFVKTSTVDILSLSQIVVIIQKTISQGVYEDWDESKCVNGF